MASESRENIKLVEYVNNLFKNWSTARQEKEVDWENNLDAFLAQNSPKWKKKDAEHKESKENWRSNVVPRTLKRKVVMAWCFICDVIFQGGEIPFMLKATKGTFDEANADMVEKGATAMEDEIRGQLTECQAERELMKGQLQKCLYGAAWIKGPVIKKKKVRKWVKSYSQGYEGVEEYAQFNREVYEKKIPAIESKSIWNMFRDPESEDIQKGRGIIERIMVSPFELLQLKGKPGYDDEAIDEVISRNKGATSNTTATLPPHLRNITERGKNITYKEFWGLAPKAYLTEEAEKEYQLKGSPANRFNVIEDVERSGEDVEVMIGIANDVLVRLHINEEDRPYTYCEWEQVPDSVDGIGPADNLQDVQKMITGGVRNFVDNKALSGNVITATVGGQLRPGQTREIYPGKNFDFEEGTNIGQAFSSIVIPDVGDGLLSLISLFEKYADEDSNLPTILQGDTRPKQKTDTLGEMNILMQNAGKYLGQVIRMTDEKEIEPMIMGFYDYNMMRDDLPPECKGDYECHALGFNSFYNKSILLAALLRFLEIVKTDPQAQMLVKFKTIYEKIAKALDLDTDELVFTDEEIQAREQAQIQQQQAMLEAQKQAEMEAAAQQAQIDDEAADQELEREMVRKDVEAKHAMSLKEKEARHDVAMKGIEARQQEKVARINGARKKKEVK